MDMEQPQIFLLHYAGGHAHSYDFLGKRIRNVVSHALELPGRGRRFQENFLLSRAAAAEDYAAQIRQKRNGQPYIIYGHSMGASLGLEVCRRLEEAGDAPRHLVVSGNSGPGVKEQRRKKKGKVFFVERWRF